MNTPTPSPLPPYLRDLEESFIAALGWGLHLAPEQGERHMAAVSDGLGLDPACIASLDLREVYQAIRTHYLDTDAFTWQAVRRSLWDAGWFGKPGTRGFSIRHTMFMDLTLNTLGTIGAAPALRKMIEEEAAKRQGGKPARGGFE